LSGPFSLFTTRWRHTHTAGATAEKGREGQSVRTDAKLVVATTYSAQRLRVRPMPVPAPLVGTCEPGAGYASPPACGVQLAPGALFDSLLQSRVAPSGQMTTTGTPRCRA